MGLDMYLSARRYLWSDDDKVLSKKISDMIDVDVDEDRGINGSTLRVKGIEIDAMYWRKANAVHGWFVENVQEDEDDCGEYHVERSQLEDLIRECEQALTSRDSKNLQPKSGFFFGSTDINEGYWSDLEDTVVGLKRALTLSNDYSFYYSSSW
jgi:hypothetical protein